MAIISAAAPSGQVSDKRSESQWATVFRRFRRHRAAMTSLVLLLIFLIASLIAVYVAPYPRDEFNLDKQFLAPMQRDVSGNLHILGTDKIGRDLFTRVLYAARVSLMLALLVATFSEVIGVALGLLAGYYLGWVDTIITRFLEFISTFPVLSILLILNSVLLQNPGLLPIPGWFNGLVGFVTGVPEKEQARLSLIIIALSILTWTGTARLMRGMVFSVREQPYIESSRALGGSDWRIVLRHILPNSLPPLIVDYTLGINGILILESVLSLLGFGVQDPTPTWGNMLADAQTNMLNYPWMPLVSGIPLVICALAVNFIGDGLRDALDPRALIGGKRPKPAK